MRSLYMLLTATAVVFALQPCDLQARDFHDLFQETERLLAQQFAEFEKQFESLHNDVEERISGVSERPKLEITESKHLITLSIALGEQSDTSNIKVKGYGKELEAAIPTKLGTYKLQIRNGQELLVSWQYEARQEQEKSGSKSRSYSSSVSTELRHLPARVWSLENTQITYDKASQKLTLSLIKAMSGAHELPIRTVESTETIKEPVAAK